MTLLHQQYRDQGFEILAFPCNQFGAQEPGTNEEVKAFARGKYGAEYPMFAKCDVNGSNTSEVYKFLKEHSELNDPAKHAAGDIPWNFAKFIVNKDGQVVSYHHPKVNPDSLTKNIEELLSQ